MKFLNKAAGVAFAIIMLSSVQAAAIVPDKEWEMKWVENYLQYYLTTSFSHENPDIKIEGFSAPNGYIFVNVQDIEYQGPFQLYIFRDVNPGIQKPDTFSADLYEVEDESWKLKGRSIPGSAGYHPESELVEIIIGENFNMKFKDPDRQKYVQIRGGKDVKVRSSVPRGGVVATVEAGQLLPYLDVTDVEVPGGSEIWYKVGLAGGSSGWVSFENSLIADDENGVPVNLSPKALDGSLFYSRPTDDGAEESLFFERKGNKVRMHFQHYVPFREPIQFVALGRIAPGTNRVDFYKGMSGDDEQLSRYFGTNGMELLEKEGHDYQEHIYYIESESGTEVYNDGNLYTEDHSLDNQLPN